MLLTIELIIIGRCLLALTPTFSSQSLSQETPTNRHGQFISIEIQNTHTNQIQFIAIEIQNTHTNITQTLTAKTKIMSTQYRLNLCNIYQKENGMTQERHFMPPNIPEEV